MSNGTQPQTAGAASPASQAAQRPVPRTNETPTQAAVREWLISQGREPVAAPEQKPIVFIPGGRISITESAEQLFRAIATKRELFYRGGYVVRLEHEGESVAIKVLDAVAAQSQFEKYVEFNKAGRTTADVVHRTTITESIAKQYLKSEECRNLLPKLNGILRCSLLVEENGQLRVLGNGYDEATGFYVTAAQPPEEMDLPDAVELITGLLHDFDFVTPGDRSRAIASLITPALKLSGLIRGPVPVDVAEANASQSGKTYRQKMVAALYNQRLAVVSKRSGGVGGMDEDFSTHLANGRAFIQFDNIRGKFNSTYLESFLTADDGSFSVRVPFLAGMTADPSKFIVFISSNGFEATRDLTNRASIIRIKRQENFVYRSLDGKDTLQLMFEWQAILIGAVFKVIKEWYRLGKQKTNDTRHDFREWSQTLDWIVQNIFHAAPLMDDHEEAKERASNPNLTFLRAVAIGINEEHRLNQSLSATQIFDLCTEKEIMIPGLSEDKQADADAGKKQIGMIFKNLFGDRTELTVEDFRVAREEESVTSEGGNAQVLKKYTFSIVTRPNTPGPTTTPAAPTPDPSPAPTPDQTVEVDRSDIPPNPTIGLTPPPKPWK